MRALRWAGRFWTGVLVVTVLLAALLLGLRLLLPLFDAPPTLAGASPDLAAGIPPRAPLTLRFSAPMNPRSVERAVQISPAFRWLPVWNDDRATLAISPTESLRPDTDYRLAIGVDALSRRFRPLAAPVELRFHTVPAPAIVTVLPAPDAADVAPDMPISIRFSRTIVPAAVLMTPTSMPDLRFDPPIPGAVTWIDQSTALFRPAAPLQPGTRYRATVAAGLSDVSGGQLGSPFTWSFSTPAPAVSATWPADGARGVAPRATLELTLTQPLALASLRASLSISPTVDGALTATDLPDGQQLVTFTPAAGWQPGTTYAATLQAGVAPVSGNLPLLKTARWSFTTAPQPALAARFPGEGQTLPNGQEIRLVFNTPMDGAAFRQAVQIAPPVGDLRVTASETEVRIAADLRAATPYTLTLPASLPDRNGIALGQPYQMRFVTAPASPALELPEAPAHLAQVLPGRPANLLVRRTNLSALSFDLYRLDEAALVRTLGFQESDWGAFQPERYGQTLLRSWRVPLSDPLNATAEGRIDLATDSAAPLPAGAYYLRLRALEGPRADLLLLVARTRLALQTGFGGALIWATDTISGTPAAGLPVALYQSGALAVQGTTDTNGLLRFARPGAANAAYVAVVGGGQFGAVSGAWAGASPPVPNGNHIFLTTDRAAYRPGERVRLAGFARAEDPLSGTLTLPRDAQVALSALVRASGSHVYQETIRVSATGVFSAAFALPADAPPGGYTVSAAIDGDASQATFEVQPDAPPLDVVVRAPPPLPAGAPAQIAVEVRAPEGLPVAGAAISWALEAAPALLPASDGYTFGDDERAPPSVALRTGTGFTDTSGRYSLTITNTVAVSEPLRYRFAASAAEAGGPRATAAGEFVVAPGAVYAGLRLPGQILAAGRPGSVEALALTPDGQPAPGAALRVEAYRRAWESSAERGPDGSLRTIWRPLDRLEFSRGAVTGADGRATLQLTLRSAGAYRLRVSADSPAGRRAYSAATVWATAPGFTGWGELPGGRPLLIADHSSYRPGDTAALLLVTPLPQTTALVTRGGPGGPDGQVQLIRAGEPFTITVREDDAPGLSITVLPAAREPPAAGASAPQPPALVSAILPVQSDRNVLNVTISADRTSYAPRATTTLTVTTTDAAGTGIPANIALGIVTADAAPTGSIADAFRTTPPMLTTVPGVAAPVSNAPAPMPAEPLPAAQAANTVYWNPALRTRASGVFTLTVQLPEAPEDLRAVAWAASADRFGQAQSTLAVTRTLALTIETPPAFRAGDAITIAARIQNTSPVSQEVEVSLSAAGVQVNGNTPLTQRVAVAAGASARVEWPAQVLGAPAVSLSVGARPTSGSSQNIQLQQAILPAGQPAPPRDAGIALLREYLDPLTGLPLDRAQIRAGQLVRARLTIIVAAAQRQVTIEDPLPGGATLVAPDLPRSKGGAASIAVARSTADRLLLSGDAVAPGIYQHSYLLRLVTEGRYSVPAPTARSAGGAAGVGNALVIDVAGSEQ